MVQVEKARRLLAELTGCISDLRRYRERFTRSELQKSRDAQHMVLRALYVAVQSSLDLAMHIGADAGLPQPATYQDAFRRLADAGIVDADLADRLAAWAGFRNVLAHSYATVDYGRAYDAMSEIDDLERFAALVAAQVGSAPP